MKTMPAFNIYKWIQDNAHLLQPPVNNKNIYPLSNDYILMVVGGPNARKDFHYNETEEFFFQLEGTIYIDIQEQGQRKRITLGPGDIFLLPARVPHLPIRTQGSVGLVVERKTKPKMAKDGLIWYCENCNHKLHEVYFTLKNIELDFLEHFKDFYSSKELRTCSCCHTELTADPKYVK